MLEAELVLENPEVALNVLKYHKVSSGSKVIVFNDDYTPMEFVIEVLADVFQINQEYATQIMMLAHYQGKALLGSYPTDIAETKVYQLNIEAQRNGHPLMCAVVNE
jgi:ATP-dependent Clp protease adaptor protein ClpS